MYCAKGAFTYLFLKLVLGLKVANLRWFEFSIGVQLVSEHSILLFRPHIDPRQMIQIVLLLCDHDRVLLLPSFWRSFAASRHILL